MDSDHSTLAQPPAAAPPPGVVSNSVHPYSDGWILITVGSILVYIMLLFVGARISAKVKITRRWSPDDYTSVVAAIGTVVYFINSILAVTVAPFGNHEFDVSVADFSSKLFLAVVFINSWTPAVIWLFVKLSFFLLYLQLFRPMRWLRYGCYIGATFNVLFYTTILATTLAVTVPGFKESLQQGVPTPQPYIGSRLPIPSASLSLVLDVYILVLPVTGVSKLQLSLWRKIGVTVVFLTGLMACVASSLGIYYRVILQRDSSDWTYEIMPVILTSLVEMTLGITASCMPLMFKFSGSNSTLSESHLDPQMGTDTHESGAYFQNKAELEDESNRRHELSAEERRYEIGTEGAIHEMSANDEREGKVQRMQEPRGEEHLQELEAPQR